MNYQDILEMDKDKAIELLKQNKIKVRIAETNDKPEILTRNYDMSRLNLIITDGKVSGYYLG